MKQVNAKWILRLLLAVAWNVISILVIWFFLQGILTSIQLDMMEFVWIWCVLVALGGILLFFSVRFFVKTVQRRKQVEKT